MSISCEMKLRILAQANAGLVAALTWPNIQGAPTFMWFDRQLAQGDIGKVSDGKACVTVQRISTQRTRFGNQGGPQQNMSAPRLQINCVSYNAEQARELAAAVTSFMGSISLLNAGAFASPKTGPSQNPNFLLNERGGMLPQLNPAAYTEIQDWRVINNENVP